MGHCSCSSKSNQDRTETNKFCSKHRRFVCENCVVENHLLCSINNYQQWVKGTIMSEHLQCPICSKNVDEERESIRLCCFCLYHVDCLIGLVSETKIELEEAKIDDENMFWEICKIPCSNKTCSTPVFEFVSKKLLPSINETSLNIDAGDTQSNENSIELNSIQFNLVKFYETHIKRLFLNSPQFLKYHKNTNNLNNNNITPPSTKLSVSTVLGDSAPTTSTAIYSGGLQSRKHLTDADETKNEINQLVDNSKSVSIDIEKYQDDENPFISESRNLSSNEADIDFKTRRSKPRRNIFD